jgi:hypothetical protein
MPVSKDITGVSAVNKSGVVVVFVEASMPDFDRFYLTNNDISLVSDNEQAVLTRTYGTATIETVAKTGVLTVQKLDINGDDAGNYVIEATHGL